MRLDRISKSSIGTGDMNQGPNERREVNVIF